MNTAIAPVLSDSFSLYDRVVVIATDDVLGDSSLPQALHNAGAIVVFAGRHLTRLAQAAEELSAHRARAIFLDSSSKDSCKEALASLVQRYGRVDILVNVLGTNTRRLSSRDEPSQDTELDKWQNTLSHGLRGAYFPSQVLGTYMAQTGGGSIINITDAFSSTSSSEVADVALTTRYLSGYFSGDGIRVNAIVRSAPPEGPRWPSFVSRTNQLFALSRMPEPNSMSNALVYLAADASASVTGTTLLLGEAAAP
jgi:NAD(P)-dependent dehydrogenase (short-subunit alcohol dehydrogenase family)